MPIKVLFREGQELRMRVMGEGHTSLQMLRERLNNHDKIEYANYFPGHPDLDDPEFYIRTKGKADPATVVNELVASIAAEFSGATL
ncbi:MAG: RpoL/Rpb11 RNA polymerase subunit family protein [Candidatus Poseidoniaceae archaeon]|jgi:DNA-directed RNA polymerase subunit L|nr:RpoL/Rpb11 RNA polymerase subunit family protein [Candidatus Poseidoniaceae archaeon]|tara:strand:+ start:3595 stop:3852 length:258 start_codon:yes stop_codon:yes gene_type:complete